MKVPCKFCGKKFHKKGLFAHQARCKSRPSVYSDASTKPIQAEHVDEVAQPLPSAFADLVNSLERFHRQLRMRLEQLASLFD